MYYGSSAAMGLGVGYLIGGLITAIIFGFITKHINESKGYTGGFAWGFWLSIIGIIVVACKPDNRVYERKEYQPMYPQAQAVEKTWRCSCCGHENSDKLSYCLRCHTDRNQAQEEKVKCPHCGAMNNKSRSTCFACNRSLKEEPAPVRNLNAANSRQATKQQTQNDNVIELIKKLADLHQSGILTDDEFSTKKAELLGKINLEVSLEVPDEKQTNDSDLNNNDSDWIDDGYGFVRCPTCNKRMSLDFIKARRKCPDCGREYTQEHSLRSHY